MTSGIHHITGITRKIQANVDFYAGFLGLRLVKRTAGYEDADQLHLFYGDAAASPARWSPSSPGKTVPRGGSGSASRRRSPSPSGRKPSASG